MQVTRSFLNGAALLAMPRFSDDRGSFTVPYEISSARAVGIVRPFVQDNHSVSAKPHTLRGVHLQLPPHEQGKLVRVLRGRILDLVLDLRPDSDTRGRHELIEVAADSDQLVWIPPGFGHGFLTLEPDTEVFYKVDGAYAPDAERSLAWDDPTVGAPWPLADGERPVLSGKDACGLDYATVLAAIDEATSA